MSAYTKEELRTVLVNHGIELPASSAKKEELVALYEQFVEPVEKSHGEFSSDDEVEISTPSKKTSRRSGKQSATSVDKSQILEEETEASSTNGQGFVDLSLLSDDLLAAELKKHGIDFGPIVETTRKLYEKKLLRLLQPASNGDESFVTTSATNGSQLKNGEFSADEEEEPASTSAAAASATEEDDEQPSAVVRKTVTPLRKSARTPKPKGSPISPRKDLGTSIRQRFTGGQTDEVDGQRFTPTPRRSIHTYKITETTTQTMVKTPDGKVAHDFAYKKETSESKSDDGSTASTILKMLPRCFLILILIAVAYYVATTYYPNALEDLKNKVQESTAAATDTASGGQEPGEPAPDQKTISDI